MLLAPPLCRCACAYTTYIFYENIINGSTLSGNITCFRLEFNESFKLSRRSIMTIDDLFKPHAKPMPSLTIRSATSLKNEYLADQFIDILLAHMNSIAVFMPNPKEHEKYITAIDSQLRGVFWRVVDDDLHLETVKEKNALEKKLEKLRKEIEK